MAQWDHTSSRVLRLVSLRARRRTERASAVSSHHRGERIAAHFDFSRKASMASRTASISASDSHLPCLRVVLEWMSSSVAPLRRTSKLPVLPGSRSGVTSTESPNLLLISDLRAR